MERIDLPVPDVTPAPVTGEQYVQFTPEKLELVGGYLIDGARNSQARAKLLALLLTNQGLAETLRLAPEENWRAAMRQVFGQH